MNLPSKSSAGLPKLRIRLADGRSLRFLHPFHIGRGEDCEVRIEDVHVSRKHVAVSFSDGQWQIRDVGSSNGMFVNGERVVTAAIDEEVTVRLGGVDGPSLALWTESAAMPTNRAMPPTRPASMRSSEPNLPVNYAERYFGASTEDDELGPQTMMIRQAFKEVQKKQKRRYGASVAAVALVAIGLGVYAYYGQQQMRQQKALAEELFYGMKALDVDIATMETTVAASGSPGDQEQVKRYLVRRRQMEANYDAFVSALNLKQQTEQERLIMRVTRTFGECDLAAPPEYLSEVNIYIRRWQSTGRFARAVKLAEEMGYTRRIAEEFIAQNLPPQFYYLAMVESSFDAFTSGPPTYMGIAKGMWQFVPDTGKRYGLTIGPLAKARVPDSGDDRHKWEKATRAAARYIKDIYSTDAQASGLLVMASYNWGEQRIIRLVKSMPSNPRERNFWKLLEKHREQVPGDTYNYVFDIVAAAVIGENPRLFGFPFDNPLGFLDKQ